MIIVWAYLHVVFEHGGGHLDVEHVVDDQLTEAGEEVTPFVKLLDLDVLIHILCNYTIIFIHPCS